jgi:DNA replication licensing factor MCM4
MILFSSPKFSKERLTQFRDLSQRPDIYQLLANAIGRSDVFFLDHIMRNVFFKAPNIFGHEDIKKGLLLQLFGGTKQFFMDAEPKSFRSQINILLCGDPCTAKSQLQQSFFRLIPHGQYINGKDTSAAGLSPYVIQDPETGRLVLQM